MSASGLPLTPFWAVALLLASALSGCSEVEPTGPKLRPDDCLRAINLADLPAAVQACDAVIAAYPNEPMPLKDRALLLSLQGDEAMACRDLHRALALARRQPPSPSSQRMLADLAVSLRTCPGRSQPHGTSRTGLRASPSFRPPDREAMDPDPTTGAPTEAASTSGERPPAATDH